MIVLHSFEAPDALPPAPDEEWVPAEKRDLYRALYWEQHDRPRFIRVDGPDVPEPLSSLPYLREDPADGARCTAIILFAAAAFYAALFWLATR